MIEKCSPHPSKEIIEKRERETATPTACARVHVRAKQIVAHCQLYRMYHGKMTEEWAADWVQTMTGFGWEKGNGEQLEGNWRYMYGCFKACNFGEILYSSLIEERPQAAARGVRHGVPPLPGAVVHNSSHRAEDYV